MFFKQKVLWRTKVVLLLHRCLNTLLEHLFLRVYELLFCFHGAFFFFIFEAWLPFTVIV